MAFIANQDEKLLGQSGAQDQNQMQATGSQANTMVSGGAPTDVTGNVSTAGVGPGGQGAWTNIQSYLNANKDNSGSGQALDKTVSNQFDNERKNFQDTSTGFVNDAYKQVNDSKIDNTQADDLIQKSALDYDWGGNQKTSYQDNVAKVQGALTGQYSGPKEFNYGFQDQTQRYGDSLKGDGFDSLMNDVYSQSAGKPLTTGQYALQKQIDVNNTSLDQSRQNLLGKYSQLETDRDNTVKDTTEKLGGVEQAYRENQNSLRDYLTGKSTAYDQQISQAEADARKAYNKDYTTGASGRAMTFADPSWSGINSSFYANQGIPVTDNMTWQNIQKEKELSSRNASATDHKDMGDYYYLKDLPNSQPQWKEAQKRLSGNMSALNDFYSTQDQKYANTADQEERSFNAILDFLNSDQAKKEQGFKVRG